MEQIRRSLNDFIYGDLSFDNLREQLEHIVAASPERALEASIILDQLCEEGKLPTGLHKELGNICLELSKKAAGNGEQDQGVRNAAALEKDSLHGDGRRGLDEREEEGSTGSDMSANISFIDGSVAEINESSAEAENQQTPEKIASPPELSPDRVKDLEGGTATKSSKQILKGRFVLEEHIATGGMGVIYKALDLRKEELKDKNPFVAIKILNEDFKAHPDALISLQREAAKAQKLAHPNIVTVYDFDRDGDTVFMTMEFLEGCPLNDLIKQSASGIIPRGQAIPIIAGMARGLANAHSKGIIHADLKPSNIFLTKEGAVKLLDFGIARAAKASGQNREDTTLFNPQSLGALTPSYASIEMFNDDGDPDPRDDIYGLACVSYELLSGRHPFKRLPAPAAYEAKLKPRRIAGLSQRQWKVLSRSLAFERSERTPDVIEFLNKFIGERSSLDTPTRKYVFLNKRLVVPALAIAAVTYLIASGFVRSWWPHVYNKANELSNSPAILQQKAEDQVEEHVGVDGAAAVSGLARLDDSGNLGREASVSTKTTEIESVEQLNVEQVNVEKQVQQPVSDDEKISDLIAQGMVQAGLNRFLEPIGDSAFEYYSQVLELDPQSVEAKKGIDSVASHYESLALASMESGDFKQSLDQVTRVLTVLPQHERLLALRVEAHNQLAEQEKRTELARLSALAKRQFVSMQLTSPIGSNAYETYRQILVLDAHNESAVEGMAAIAAHYQSVAVKRKQNGDLRGSLEQITRGLKVLPQHEDLLVLREQVKNDLAKRTKRTELEEMLDLAKRQFSAMQLTSPAGDNAYETYKSVLVRDPRSREAGSGLKNIADKYLQLAVSEQRIGNTDKSLAMINKGLIILPKHTGLRQLRKDINGAKARLAESSLKIKALFEQAARQSSSSRLIGPAGNNALESYKSILRIEPGNQQALQGISGVSSDLEIMARVKLNNGALEDGLSITNNALKYLPENAGLLLMKAELEQAFVVRRERQLKEQKTEKRTRVIGTF